jgi:hypothetical protein
MERNRGRTAGLLDSVVKRSPPSGVCTKIGAGPREEIEGGASEWGVLAKRQDARENAANLVVDGY